jgi:hypothetical protein
MEVVFTATPRALIDQQHVLDSVIDTSYPSIHVDAFFLKLPFKNIKLCTPTVVQTRYFLAISTHYIMILVCEFEFGASYI